MVLNGVSVDRLSHRRVLLNRFDTFRKRVDEDRSYEGLDAITEQEVMKELDALMNARSTIIITHRLAGREKVDEILVLREGRILKRGQHHELMQLGGLYHQMYKMQNQVLS